MQDATFRIYENVGFQAVDTVPEKNATFRTYENVGFQAADVVPLKAGNFRVYENVAYYMDPSLHREGTVTTYENTGTIPIPLKDGAFVVYENVGVAPGHRLTIIRQPRGWGVIPTGPQTIIILDDAATGTTTTYENTV